MKEMYCFLFIFILWAANIRHSEQAQINIKFIIRQISPKN